MIISPSNTVYMLCPHVAHLCVWVLSIKSCWISLKEEPVELNEKSVNKCKDSVDSFDKDLIRRVVVGFFFERWICVN